MVALVDGSGATDLLRAFLHVFLRVRIVITALLGGVARPFLLAVFREISLRSARAPL